MSDWPSLQEQFVRYGGLNGSAADMWMRDRLAALFDLNEPTPRQRRLVHLATQRVLRSDLPYPEWASDEKEMRSLAEAEFGPPPL